MLLPGKRAPVTTTFRDAYRELPQMDDVDMGEPIHLSVAPRNPETGALNGLGDKKKESKWLRSHMENLINWYGAAGDAISGRSSEGATQYDPTGSITLPAEVMRQRGGHASVLKGGPRPDRSASWDDFR